MRLRKCLLEKAFTDQDLFEIALLAQWYDKTNWLDSVVSDYLESTCAFDQAKGLCLLGFMDSPAAGEYLDTWITEKPDSWIRDCAERAKRIYDRNQWARHWFQRFATHSETLQAWAAFRLLLHCVDGTQSSRRTTVALDGTIFELNFSCDTALRCLLCRNHIFKHHFIRKTPCPPKIFTTMR